MRAHSPTPMPTRRCKCRIDVPIVISANDFPTQVAHIKDAQEGNGNNFSGQKLPAALRYQEGSINRQSWPQKRITGGKSTSPNGLYGCLPENSSETIKLYADDLDCDEYPFNASMESGFSNYKQGRVSGRFIPYYDNREFRRLLSPLSKIRKESYYIVAPLEFAPKSMIINKP